MAFRKYKLGSRFFGLALGGSMCITLFLPAFDFAGTTSSKVALDKAFSAGWETGFNLDDPFLQGKGKPVKVTLRVDPQTNKPMEAREVYVFNPGVKFPAGINHTRILGKGVEELSVQKGRIGEAKVESGAVFGLADEGSLTYVQNLTALKGWTPASVIKAVTNDDDVSHAGAGKTMFVREGCWWCHTLLPEQTQDWQVFGAPPMIGDFNGESPTAFGSDRKAPDLLHVASRNSSREWMMMHFFNPRLVQPHSIMPRFDYLWGDTDANGQKIDYNKWRAEYIQYREGARVTPPEVPKYSKNSEIRYLIDYMMSLK